MSLDLFHRGEDPLRTARTTPFVAWPFSVAFHVAVLAAVLVMPLMAADVLPTPRDLVNFVRAVPLAEPPAAPAPVRPSPVVARAIASQRLAPVNVPATIGQEPGIVVPTDVGLSDLRRGGSDLPGGIEGGTPVLVEQPPVAPPPPEPPVRPGGRIQPPEKVYDVKPEYPELAQKARIEGVVIIEAIIGRTGAVEQATVLRSIPLLDAAALAAVRQWRFTPTLLNGQPIAVIMTVTVHFRLGPPKN